MSNLGYPTKLTAAEVEALTSWHEHAYQRMRAEGDAEVVALGLELEVPAEVFGPTPMADMLGSAILEEVRPDDRVLDMGTGTGINAILAASKAREVIGVDVNPYAVEAARRNAARNGVTSNTSFAQSDLFEHVSGEFDVVIFDPPFRWL